jgi:fructose-1,6-bisphosphatase/sedoheptulose 1,7-bisphosphatase-like protein
VLSAIILKALGGQMTARLLPGDANEAALLQQRGIAGCNGDALTLNQIVGGNAMIAIASVTGTQTLPAPRPTNGKLEIAGELFSTLLERGTEGPQMVLEQYPEDKC